ncbi:IclR family transcriptional regulator [Nesterenkonia sp. CL21]
MSSPRSGAPRSGASRPTGPASARAGASPSTPPRTRPTEPPLDPPRPLHTPSGIGVVDKSVMILDALEAGPASLAQLVECTGLARPTVHRLASALIHHRFLSRDVRGRYVIGSRLAELASAAGDDRLVSAAGPILLKLRDATGESSQLYRRQGDARVCVASAERPIGLRDSIPVGTQLSMKAGSAAQVLLAWEDHERLVEGLQGARFTPTVLAGVRRRGWGESLGEREPGVASVSAPVRGPSGRVIAAVSISGPIERLTRQPGRQHAEVVVQAAHQLTELVRKNPDAAEHGLGEDLGRH